jgi:hypothetical protein
MRTRRRHASAIIALAILLAPAPAVLAHEFWIEPTTFLPDDGKIVGIRARVGDGVLGDPVPRDPALLERLVVDTGTGPAPVVGRDGGDPAGLLRIATGGLHVVGYLGKPTPIQIPADTFNAYLKDEGLDEVIAERARRGATQAGARELFTRCAKTLLQAGPARPDQRDRVLGFPLELVAQANPYTLARGGELSVTLLYRGRPLPGALVTAIRRKTGERLPARSDALGRARFVFPADGAWLITTVHMTAPPRGTKADWVSYWASLTFELQPLPQLASNR